jgi:hypothetical protein
MNNNRTKRHQECAVTPAPWKRRLETSREDSLDDNWQKIGDVAARCVERIKPRHD